MTTTLSFIKGILFASNDNYRGRANRILAVVLLLTFSLPTYLVITNNVWVQHSAFWIIHSEPLFGSLIRITFYDPISTFVYWLPMLYVSYVIYRFVQSESSEAFHYIAKVIIATCILLVFIYLDYVVNSWPNETIMVPLPYASIIALTVGLRIRRPTPSEPWQNAE